MKKALSILFGALLAVAADAATFRVQYEGKQLPGSEICVFNASSFDGPLERLTTFTSVRCLSADSDVPLPKGVWSLFARNKDGYVSTGTLRVSDGRVEGDQREIDLERAGHVRFGFELAKSEKAAIYVERSGVVLPLVPGESEVLAPAGAAIFPLVIEDRAISRIGVEILVDTARVVTIQRPAVNEGRRDFAVGLVPDRVAFDAIPVGERPPGRIELAAGDAKPSSTVNRVDPVFKGREALALFRQVPSVMGKGVVRVAGDGWSSTGGELKAFRAEGPLRIAPTTSLSVHWSVLDDVVKLAAQLRRVQSCSRTQSPARPPRDVPGVSDAGLTLTLVRCPALQAATQPDSVRKGMCTQVASATLDQTRMAGSETLRGIAPGVYLLRLGFGTLPAAFETIEVSHFDDIARIELRYDRWFGKVTRDREPLFAQIGMGDGAVSDPATGEYFTVSIPVPPPSPAIAARMFKDPLPIDVVGCDSEVHVVFTPEEQPVPNTRFDIEIVPNHILLHVIDEKTTKPVAGAAIDYSAMRRDYPDDALFGGPFGKTDEKGELRIDDVPRNREVEVCASHAGYRRNCASRFVMNDDREREVTIPLEVSERHTGRVLNPAVVGGLVMWCSADGRALESAELAADGTFSYESVHAQGEIVAVVSPGAPLLVLRQPVLRDDEPFEIQFPAAPVRNFNVVLSRHAREVKGFVSLSIGDIVVPLNVLSRHLQARGVRPLFLSPGEIPVRDIVASGPVSFIFAPLSWAEIYFKDPTFDFFHLPAAAALPRVPAGNGATVVIGD